MSGQPTTILVVTQTFPPVTGGMEALMGGLARALADHTSVEVHAHDRGGSAVTAHDRSLAFPVQRYTRWRRWIGKNLALRAALRRGSVAVITDSWKSLEPLASSLCAQARVLCLVHGDDIMPRSQRRGARIRRTMTKADHIIANSSPVAELALQYLPKGASNVHVIPPGIGKPTAPNEGDVQIKEISTGNTPVIATLTRLVPRKGVDMVIRAIPALAATFPEVVYLVGGDGPDRTRLEALASELNVTAHVRFLGRLGDSEKTALLRRADLFAMPARIEDDSIEGFGIAYLEAASCGTPALAGTAGGARDAVVDGETGWLCDGDDPDSVQKTLSTALADKATLAARGEAARLRSAEFEWKRIAQRYLKLTGVEQS